MLNLHRLRLLAELNRLGTISAVAEALSYSPSTVSQQLDRLEAEAGARLLEPVGRRVRLTVVGRILAEHAETVLSQVERAETAVLAATTGVGGAVRLGCFQTAALHLVPPTLSVLAESHPTLQVEVFELPPEQSLPALMARDVDVVIDEEYPGNPKARSRAIDERDLLKDPLRLVLPSRVPWLGVDDVRHLADATWVMEPPGSAARQWTNAVCRQAGFEPRVRFESSDLLVHKRLVETGHACALLPELVLEDSAGGLLLRALPGDPARRVFTAARAGAANSLVVDAVRSALGDVLVARAAAASSSR